jgi:nucleotide-binding universal stress UspA family protein
MYGVFDDMSCRDDCYLAFVITIREKKRSKSARYDKILIEFNSNASVEYLVDMGCDYLSAGGELLLMHVIEVPTQLPFEYALSQRSDTILLLESALSLLKNRNVRARAKAVNARDRAKTILDLAIQNNVGLIIVDGSRRSIIEKLLLCDVGDTIMRKSKHDVMVIP